jgi:hypothetical protein
LIIDTVDLGYTDALICRARWDAWIRDNMSDTVCSHARLDVDHRNQLAEMDEAQQKIVNETLTDDVLLNIEEHNSTSNHLSQRGTRFYAGVLGASESFLLASVLVSAMWAVDKRALLLFFVVGCAGVPTGLAIAACKSVIAADECNAEEVS